jgi:shikimate kinase
MESWWGTGLQDLRDRLGLKTFLQAEEQAVLQLRLHRTVLSTGGSVVYSHTAMRHLKAMGMIVHVHATLDTVRSRIAAAPQRGLLMPAGMTLDELYAERQKLYTRYEDFRVTTDMLGIAETCGRILGFWETHT